MSYYNTKFAPKAPVRTFRDLEVYQKTMEVSVVIFKNLRPKLNTFKYIFAENLVQCSMAIPLHISEAHSLRFGDHKKAILLLETAMAGCNKMIVYLEQVVGVYGNKLDQNLVEDLIKRYSDARGKIFRLEKAWQKWDPPES